MKKVKSIVVWLLFVLFLYLFIFSVGDKIISENEQNNINCYKEYKKILKGVR